MEAHPQRFVDQQRPVEAVAEPEQLLQYLDGLQRAHDAGDRNTALGAGAAEHDLAALAGHRLRSHGGAGEQSVPFLLSHPLGDDYVLPSRDRKLRNFDIFDVALNGVGS